MNKRTQFIVRGIVQGVGFRPFVYSSANRRSLTGRVLNNGVGVLIDVQGEPAEIDQFGAELEANPPPLSIIESIERLDHLAPVDYRDFQILESDATGAKLVPVSADVATCDECVNELFDARNRRYRYPFINCTNCGPRFTITESVPYDRRNTTMRMFAMCEECRHEYDEPLNRRFHAEPIACARCGPQLRLLDREGREVAGDPLSLARDLLQRGKILAIKGIGGFHLACDALSSKTVADLRSRKVREDKPFALMANSLSVIRRYARVSDEEAALLQSPAHPIVLLQKKDKSSVPETVAPGVNSLGVMLPYSPLHYLLLENSNKPLVMTSGNVSDEPICYHDDDAGQRLSRIADYFLFHDRNIHVRTDDSVVRLHDGREMILRRSRGYAPAPIRTAFDFARPILACGAELKNTFCFARDHTAFVSHHIGDLENLETLSSFTEGIEHYRRLFAIDPEVVAYDLHPEYLSTKYALALGNIEEKIAVQHHHAHVASCMTDNQIDGEVIGVAFDGLGYGLDGKMWGGEFFVADFCQAERMAHLAYVPLPGGVQAIREPWRLAAVYLERTFGQAFLDLGLEFNRRLDVRKWSALRRMMTAGLNCPQTSSMGRLFDAVAGLLCVREVVNYEGQAAIELEGIATRLSHPAYEFKVEAGEIYAEAVIRSAVENLLDGTPASEIAARFHLGVAELIVKVATQIRQERHLNRVVLSGGVFQNMLLLHKVCQLLRESEFAVFTHSRVPANDGGISLGQAAVANACVQRGRYN
ncbi:MAG TPA: carbamoyltransferase HypF [Pyrinomonadaceae bacterium]|nr:carbamoyltransferase HypF [Pyrinomonadaceae bacterium]